MNLIRRTLDIDADTDARLREMADERGQDVAAVPLDDVKTWVASWGSANELLRPVQLLM